MGTGCEHKQEHAPTTRRLWGGWMLPFIAWGAHLMISYSFVEWYCNNPHALEGPTVKAILHGTTLFALLMAAYGVWLAWACRRWIIPDGTAGRNRSRALFMANAGLMSGLFLIVVIVVQGVPNVVLEPCF